MRQRQSIGCILPSMDRKVTNLCFIFRDAKNAIEKAFASAKQSTIKWYGEYTDYRYRLDESDNQTTYEVVLRLSKHDIDLTIDGYLSELAQL